MWQISKVAIIIEEFYPCKFLSEAKLLSCNSFLVFFPLKKLIKKKKQNPNWGVKGE